MKKSVCLFAVIITLLVTCASATDINSDNMIEIQASHHILLEGLSWKSYGMDCQEGDILSGSFEVLCDGSLYMGDEQKYDDWSLEGIEFYILDAENYSLFIQREPFEPAYARNNVLSLSWTFDIPSDGVWYVVYDNRTIYLMNIDGSMNRIDDSNFMIVMILSALGGITAAVVILVMKRR